MTTILPLSAARALPEVIFRDPVRQRGGKATKPKKRPKRGTGVGDGQENGNGKQKEVSWIWVTQVDRGNPAAVNEALRIEWARTRAKAHRWSEEVDLLEEEMRRIRAFLTWHSKWWMERATQSVWQADEVTREGKPMRFARRNSRPTFAPASAPSGRSSRRLSGRVGKKPLGLQSAYDLREGLVLLSSSRETAVGDAASGVHNESAVVDGDGESDTDSKCESRGEAGDDTLLFPS
ncbi:hypothetical protein GGX14DRAFT_403533 [Mycena pura]|uniref:Uncharacterized protein n=1 Tax=Mycena pura TaxID=153505 RepID=A0AAD6UWE4_9AGAR|nr:hypothetical protein GGX14DRAFT_403533 [Mycena pura]